MGWMPEALKFYRVFLLDERGTGRSTRIDSNTPELLKPEYLSLLRPPDIVRDAEAIRRVAGIDKWDAFGNSFGGLCVASYLSYFPESIGHAFITGSGIPLEFDPDEFHRITFKLLIERQNLLFDTIPNLGERIQEVSEYLAKNQVVMPTGERLTPERFKMIGVLLGEEGDFERIAQLLEAPFTSVLGTKRIRTDFLWELNSVISLEKTPLWAVIQETMLAKPGTSSNWSAERVKETMQSLRLFGNHFYQWHFSQDPALIPFKNAVDSLASFTGYEPITIPNVLIENEVPSIALFYEHDLFMPPQWFLPPTEKVPNVRTLMDSEHLHDGIYTDGASIFKTLLIAAFDRQ